MNTSSWQLDKPISAVIFDCDSTLTRLEGIDELAKKNGSHEEVSALTYHAMTTQGLNADLFRTRLQLVKPMEQDLINLGQAYYQTKVPDALEIIQLLKRLQKSIFIVSAGLNPAVTIFGNLLQIPHENIFAVNMQFNANGEYIDFDVNSPLIKADGKRTIVEQLKIDHPNLIHIGDGSNDIVTRDLVTRFIGYGGVVYKEKVAKQCNYYINTLSLAPLLPLILTHQEYDTLHPSEQMLYQKGLTAIHAGEVILS